MIEIQWEYPDAADAAARLGPNAAGTRCTVLRVPTTALHHAWRSGSDESGMPHDTATTSTSIEFGRALERMQRTRAAPAPLVRFAAPTGLPDDAPRPAPTLSFVDGREVAAAAIAIGAAEIDVVMASDDAPGFVRDVGGRVVATLPA